MKKSHDWSLKMINFVKMSIFHSFVFSNFSNIILFYSCTSVKWSLNRLILSPRMILCSTSNRVKCAYCVRRSVFFFFHMRLKILDRQCKLNVSIILYLSSHLCSFRFHFLTVKWLSLQNFSPILIDIYSPNVVLTCSVYFN